MRTPLLFFVAALLGACQSQSRSEDNNSDSVHVADTTIIIPDDDVDTAIASAPDFLHLDLAIQQLLQSQETRGEDLYRLELSASGYEYQTSSTWFFDTTFSLIGNSQSWASEGTEGNSNHFFALDRLYAFRNVDGSSDGLTTVKMYHRDFGGIAYHKADEGADDTTLIAIDASILSQEEADLKMQLREIITSLREHKDDVTESGSSVTLEFRNEAMYGTETFTEKSEISLEKALLEELLK